MKVKSITYAVFTAGFFAAGLGGTVLQYQPLRTEGPWFFALALVMTAYSLLARTYYRSETPWPADSTAPRALKTTPLDYLKAFVCWLDSFKRTYAVQPGLYYTGKQYDHDAPLLVTANYHLTVFLLARRLRNLNVRLLVVNTDGINVWCAAGKGTFSTEAILEQLNRYEKEIIGDPNRPTLILPKLSLSGVNLAALQDAGFNPVIGPVYDKDLPAYLSREKPKDCDSDHVTFNLRSRLFTIPPGTLQDLKYAVMLLLVLWLVHKIWYFKLPIAGVLTIVLFLQLAYPISFPCLPGKWFATKGFWLGIFASLILTVLAACGAIATYNLVCAVLFTLACGMYFGQRYSGNSAVSNMTSIRKETARLLPVYVLLYIASLAAFFIKEALL